MKKTISTPAGATPEEWQYLEMLSPADRACVLPIVSNSKIPAIGGLVHSDKRGKIPSVLTCKNGVWHAAALPGWQTHQTTDEDINKWSRQKSLGYGFRTGHNGVLAVDIDIDDPGIVADMLASLAAALDVKPEEIPVRTRSNSAHCAVLVRIDRYADADLPVSKVKGILPASDVLPSSGMVELMGVGRQMALCGTHPSGVRYTWSKNPFPLLNLPYSCFAEWCRKIASEYGFKWKREHDTDTSSVKPGDVPQVALEEDWVAAGLQAHGLVLGYNQAKHLVYIECPWRASHSDAGDVTSTAYCLPSLGHHVGGFICMHEHCRGKHSTHDFLDYLKDTYGIKEPAGRRTGGAYHG